MPSESLNLPVDQETNKGALGRRSRPGSVETEFPAIVFNDTLISEAYSHCEPTVSSLNDKIDFRISFDESDDEDYMVIYDKNSFSNKIIFVNDLKTDSENDNDKVNMPSFPSPEPKGLVKEKSIDVGGEFTKSGDPEVLES
ncbi:hypothetical protein Tco_0367460 [Tanacetum coccineum]